MPPVIAAIAVVVAFVVEYAAVISAVIAIASAAYSIYAMSNMPKASAGYSADVAGRVQVVRSAVTPHRVVYGKCMISGALAAAFSNGGGNNYLYLVIVLTNHEVAGIDDVYLGDTVSTDLKYASLNGGLSSYHCSFNYTVPVGGVIKLDHAVLKDLKLYIAPHTVDGVKTLIDPSLYTLVNDRTILCDNSLVGEYIEVAFGMSFVSITKHLGAPDQAADSFLVEEATDHAGNHIWTSEHTLSGRAYLVVRLEYHPVIFPGGIPNIKAIVRGVNDIYDPRTETTGWSDNPALCVRDYLVKSHGIGVPAADINDDSFIAAANICDEQVPIAVGTGTGYMTDGQYYETGMTGINLVSGTGTILAGDTVTITIESGDYSINGTSTHFPASANSYVVETALTSGYLVLAGGGLIAAIPPTNCAITVHTTNQENRYTCNGSFTLDSKPVDIMKSMLTSCAGRLVWSQGAYSIFPAAYNYPVGTLTESDLRDDISVMPAPSRQQRFNTVRGVFVSPDQYWQQVDFPYQQNAAQYAADGSEICQTLELPYTLDSSMAQRLAAIYLNQNLRGIIVNFPAKLSAFPYQPGDVVNLSISQLGWNEKGFRITDWKLSDTGGVDLVMKEEDPAVYGWTLTDQKPFSPPAKTHIASYNIAVPDVTNFGAFQSSNFVIFSWDNVDANIAGYEIRYNQLGDTTWGNGTPITKIAKGTHLVSLKVPPGAWTFLICATDVLGNYSQNAASCDLTVLNVNLPIIDLPDQSALGWPGTKTNFIKHCSGALAPASQGTADQDGDNTFNLFCPQPYDSYIYETPEITLGSDQIARALAQLTSILGPGEAGVANPQLYIKWKVLAGDYNDYQAWSIGSMVLEAITLKIIMITSVGLASVTSFKPILDQPGLDGGNAV
jgi:hypothetical protein